MDMMKLQPAGKDYLWGGTRLKNEYHKKSDLTPLAETWECFVHPDGASRILNGQYQGNTLAELLQKHPEYCGTNHPDGFPIVIKFIDAEKDLSVQIHPDDDYARKYEHQNGKTEMWYVLDAEESASLIYGFEKEISRETVGKALSDGTLIQYLKKIPVHKGEVFYIPAGTVHAIGKGALIAEIQENSNLTYRVYDYNRTDKNGNKRELHLKKALQVMQTVPAQKQPVCGKTEDKFSYSMQELCHCSYFNTDKIRIKEKFSFSVERNSFQVLLCIDGSGSIQNHETSLSFQKGKCIFLPAGIGNCIIEGKTELLKISC